MAEIEEITVEESPLDQVRPGTSTVTLAGVEFKLNELTLEGILELFAMGAHTLIGDYQNPIVLVRGLLGNPMLKRRILELSLEQVPLLKAKFEIELIKAIWELNKDFFLNDLPLLMREMNFGAGQTRLPSSVPPDSLKNESGE
jgi:hypothetical protein